MKLFHIAPARALPGILREGLRPPSPTWPVHLGTEPGLFDTLVEFCHDDPATATIVVDVDGFPIVPGIDGPQSRCCYVTIPPERIVEVQIVSQRAERILP